ncbi:type IV secretory system conjugative DNA transfer family protein [Nitrosopumilus sp.]|uniref:type IV secretory system conjugative DNA transfer family protein n=1 Tax=Nitrosopumilus sp. TaxID=2024843 RepID=UPI0029311D7B|nr:TraM recognition domain-containing protein [Nitrosopumilus sp.]
MSKFWSLSNIQKQNGQLDKTKEFLGTTSKKSISCCEVIIPITMDVKSAILTASSIVGKQDGKALYHNHVRSFEIWWNGSAKRLRIVLTAQSRLDLENFKTSFRNVYPNVSFVNLKNIAPDWFVPTKTKYQIFDVSLHHGHYSTVFDKTNAHKKITQISNTIQLSKNAWMQFVFAPYNFTPYLKNHLTRLNRRIKHVTSKNYRTWVDDLTNKSSYENPENGLDFYNHYKELISDVSKKNQKSHVIISIRGLIDATGNSSDEQLISFSDVKSNHDHLTEYSYRYDSFYHNKKPKKAGSPITISGIKKDYQRISLFDLRLIPSPKNMLNHAIRDYFEKTILSGNYKTRKPLPFLILNADEIPLFVHLPDPTTTQNIQTTRNVSLPSKQTRKIGLNIGYQEKMESENESDYSRSIYGKLVKSTDEQCSVISPVDFSRHGYVVGGTGSGKTTLLRQIAKHLEMLNINGRFPNAFIYLDPKGDDSLKFIQQCEEQSISKGNINFLDPNATNFSINPLELPKHPPDKREETVSRYVGYFMEIVKEWYGQQQTFVQMERIFRVLLFYMYLKNDSPTFLDMYEIIIHLQEEQEKFLQVMYKALGMPGDDLKQALTSIASLKPDSFNPLLNRVEQFATDDVLKKVFCVRHGTVKFEDLIEQGQYTIVRISSLHLAHHIQPLAIQAFVIKLWFTIQERAARIKREEDRDYVILALDEFQIVKDLQVLPNILSQARSYHLGLLLAHQTTAQITDSLLEEITGNCGTQLAGRISGKDASKIANIWDPKFSKELTQQIASQQDFRWTIKMRAASGEEQSTPMQFWLHNPPKFNMSQEQVEEFIRNQRDLYGHGKVEEGKEDSDHLESQESDENSDDNDYEINKNNTSLLQLSQLEKNRWLRYITVDLPETKQHWQILLMLYKENNTPLQLTQITERLQAKTRDDVVLILKKMVKDDLLDAEDSNRNVKYSLTEKATRTYFTFDSKDIGTADDIPQVTKHVVKSYLDMGLFVTVALQKIEKDEDRTDLIAYSYDSDKSISVEIESASELLSHPEHAIYNMRKWSKMGFDICHVWSASKKLQEIYDSQITKKEAINVKVFVIKDSNL